MLLSMQHQPAEMGEEERLEKASINEKTTIALMKEYTLCMQKERDNTVEAGQLQYHSCSITVF